MDLAAGEREISVSELANWHVVPLSLIGPVIPSLMTYLILPDLLPIAIVCSSRDAAERHKYVSVL